MNGFKPPHVTGRPWSAAAGWWRPCCAGGAGTLFLLPAVVVLLAIGAARAAVVCLLLAAVLALCYVAVGVRAPPGRGILTSAARAAALAVARSAGATGAK